MMALCDTKQDIWVSPKGILLFSTYFTTVRRRPAYCQKVNLRPQDFLMSSALNFINEKR